MRNKGTKFLAPFFLFLPLSFVYKNNRNFEIVRMSCEEIDIEESSSSLSEVSSLDDEKAKIDGIFNIHSFIFIFKCVTSSLNRARLCWAKCCNRERVICLVLSLNANGNETTKSSIYSSVISIAWREESVNGPITRRIVDSFELPGSMITDNRIFSRNFAV